MKKSDYYMYSNYSKKTKEVDLNELLKTLPSVKLLQFFESLNPKISQEAEEKLQGIIEKDRETLSLKLQEQVLVDLENKEEKAPDNDNPDHSSGSPTPK